MRLFTSILLLAVSGAAWAQLVPPPVFPGQMRPPGDPVVEARGRQIYDVHCRACHGADLRGGDLGGPNLLRSQLVLTDEAGEAIGPVIRNGRTPEGGRPMPPLPLPPEDISAIATFIHGVIRTAQPQGAPPPGSKAALNLLVGNVRDGERFFRRECTACHSVSDDLAGIGTRLADVELLQNSWVSGRRLGGTVAPRPARRAQVKVQLKSGTSVSGTLERMDDFLVSVRAADGSLQNFARRGGAAAVAGIEVDDPMAGHRKLWVRLTNDDMHDVTAYLATVK